MACMDSAREFAMKVDSARKIPCRTGELNLSQQCGGLSFIPTPCMPVCCFVTYSFKQLTDHNVELQTGKRVGDWDIIICTLPVSI